MKPSRRNTRTSLCVLGIFALLIGTASPGGAAPGELDTSFDGDGKVTKDFGGNFDGATGLALQEDGKIVVAGSSLSWDQPNGADFALARYQRDGSPDATFGRDGTVTTDFAGLGDEASALALHSDGHFLVAGFTTLPDTSHDFAIARYNSNGSLDTSFGGDGKVTTDFEGSEDYALGAAIQADGKIVAAGFMLAPGNSYDFALARYNVDGSLDATFDGDGKVTTDFGDGRAAAVAIHTDGKIVAAGNASVPGISTNDFALARYNPDGSLDTTFDGDGKVTTDFSAESSTTGDFCKALVIQADGRVIAVGHTLITRETGGDPTGSDFNLAVARYNYDGSLDTALAHKGTVTTDRVSSGRALAIQEDGRIIVAGDVDGDFALARFNTDGFLDNRFGAGDGIVTTDFHGRGDGSWAVAIQPDKRIVAAGQAGTEAGGDFAIARYTVCRRVSMRSSISCR